MKILYCLTGLERGGAETQVVELACRMRARGHSVTLISICRVEHDWTPLVANGVKLHSLEMVRGRPTISGILHLLQLWRQIEPDVVHGHMFHANILIRLARPFASQTRVICTAHSRHEGGAVRTLMYAASDFLADITTNVSKDAVANYIAKGAAPGGRICWMANGVDVDRYHSTPKLRYEIRKELSWGDQDFVWLAVGRLAEPKDYPTMFAACAELKRMGAKKWRLVVAGDGPLRASLESKIHELGLERDITLMGLRADIPRLMCAADGYVMSSAWEGLPMVLLEASAAGLLAVATDVGGNREVIHHNKTGFLLPAGSPRLLAAVMAETMASPAERRAAMGKQAREFVHQKYHIEHVVSAWEMLYAKLSAPADIC